MSVLYLIPPLLFNEWKAENERVTVSVRKLSSPIYIELSP
jgi:hypothetical protein